MSAKNKISRKLTTGLKCAAYGCSSSSDNVSTKAKNIKFFRFPLDNPILLQKWLLQIRRKDFVPKRASVICSEHFTEENFESSKSANEQVLKKNAYPTKFNFPGSVYGWWNEVEVKMNDPTKGYKAFLGQREKQCRKCGFATFSLNVLYKHRHKCRGRQLGPGNTCSFCKRKFIFLSLYKRHQPLCVKKVYKRKLLREKLKERHLGFKAKDASFSCPICEASFDTKHKFVNHLKKQSCQSPIKKRKLPLSARKSTCRKSFRVPFSEQSNSALSWPEKDSFLSHDDELYHCSWCKSYYPTQKLLKIHIEINKECANALNRSKLQRRPSLKARKSLTVSAVAKKSFSKASMIDIRAHKRTRSARKSLPSSNRKSSYDSSEHPSDIDMPLKECPVCFRCFTDIYSFFLHQKKMNHWGKATKSFNSVLKCPFCAKEFTHIFSRDAHLKNHTDVANHKIKAFFKNHTCNVCSTSFASVLAKIQHERISSCKNERHASGDSDYRPKPKLSSVPKSVKKKLKRQPNSCPVCCKGFSHTILRNKHFNEAHLKIFECQVCNTKFKSMSSLNNHIKHSHTSEYECRGCKISFKDELNLLQHVLKSHPSKDPKLFLPSKLLNSPGPEPEKPFKVMTPNNERSQPSGSMEFYCDVCNIGYLKLCGLQSHRQSKLHKATLERKPLGFHRSRSDVPSVAAINPQKAKLPEILICSECSAEFTNIKDFVPHRLSHFSVQGKYLRINEQNPYMCEICSEVLDSHSKVQLHLFWHLQIESTALSNGANNSIKNKTIVPDRLSGQLVAKKSFSKEVSDSPEEVTIAGVTKPLFTCEHCKVGFTTKEHYSMHVRKLCKKGRFGTALQSSEVNANNKLRLEPSGIVHCIKCNFLFSNTNKLLEHKPHCVKVNYNHSDDHASNLKAVKSALTNNLAVAGCVTCGAVFDHPVNISHLSSHQHEKSNADSCDVPEKVQHCALCNSLFSLSAFNAHKEFCKIPLDHQSSRGNFKHTSTLKSALELRNAVAGCISCGESFDHLNLFRKHLNMHQTGRNENDSQSVGHLNGENISLGKKNESEDDLGDSTSKSSSEKTGGNVKKQASSEGLSLPEDDAFKETIKTANNNFSIFRSIEELRENFSKLLSILIADSELMETLGYGKLLIEDVLVNVLKQMGQASCTEPKLSISDKFQKNIMTLLNLCLKDEVMQDIGKDKTVEEIVIGALNIFDAE